LTGRSAYLQQHTGKAGIVYYDNTNFFIKLVMFSGTALWDELPRNHRHGASIANIMRRMDDLTRLVTPAGSSKMRNTRSREGRSPPGCWYIEKIDDGAAQRVSANDAIRSNS